MALTEKQIETIGLPDKFFINECTIKKGIMSFLCPKCEEEHNLQTKLFSSEGDKKENNIVPTNTRVNYLRSTIPGWALGIIPGITLLSILSATKGGYTKTQLFMGVGIWLISKAIIDAILKKRLPVWIMNCGKCQEKLFLASNGKIFATVSPSKQMRRGKENEFLTNQCDGCKKFYPKYDLKPFSGRRLCPDCRKKAYERHA